MTPLAAMILAACARNEAAEAPAAPPPVQAAKVVSKSITEFDEFTGRFEAVESVEVRPRVSGYVMATRFAQGHEVKKGDILYVIDARPYQATLKHAQAELTRARTQAALAESERVRATKLIEKRAISQEEFDARTSGNEQAAANLQAAEAAVESAALDLSFTEVRAPISGLVGRAEITAGNLVAAGQTLLTTVVSIDPIYVSFDGDEQVYLKYVGMASARRAQAARATRRTRCGPASPMSRATRTKASWCSSTTSSTRTPAPSTRADCSRTPTGVSPPACSRA